MRYNHKKSETYCKSFNRQIRPWLQQFGPYTNGLFDLSFDPSESYLDSLSTEEKRSLNSSLEDFKLFIQPKED